MKTLHLLVLTAFLGGAAAAARETPADPDATIMQEAAGLDPAEFLWVARPVMIFADSPQDPQFVRQMELLARDSGQLAERDVVIIIDTDPTARSAFRQRFRPRGFSLVMMDKDGITTLRKPLPWEVREISNAIDKFPTARQEALDRYPSGR